MLEDNVSNLTVNNDQESPEGSQNWIKLGNLRDHNSEGPIVLYDTVAQKNVPMFA